MKKKITKITSKLLALVFVFSMLQSHMFIVSEFAGKTYAAISTSLDGVDRGITSTIDDEIENISNSILANETSKNEIKQTDEKNKKDEQTVENEVTNQVANKPNQTDDLLVENTIAREEATEEDLDSVDKQKGEEKINASLKIVDAYRSLNGIVVRTNVGIELENKKDTVKESKTNMAMPVVEGYTIEKVYLEDVKGIPTSSHVNSSNDGKNFEVIILNDTALNEFKCEYTVVYVFKGTGKVEKLSLEIENTLKFEDDDTLNSKDEFSMELDIPERKVNEYSNSSKTTSIYKGYLYANASSTLGYSTKYTTIDSLSLDELKGVDYIWVREAIDVIKNKDGSELSLENLNDYISSKVKKDEFDKVFGENGYMEVYSSGKVLGRIDSKTKVEDGYYVFKYDQKVSNVEFKLNMLKEKGSMEIINEKIIRKTTTFSRAQILGFSKIESKLFVQEFATVGDTEVELYSADDLLEIVLEDTTSRMDLEMNVNTLSTTIENDVTFMVTLRTDQEKYDLFKNPEILIELPNDITEVEIVNINLLYKNGLSVDTYEVINGEYGKKIIKIRLVGTQIEYTPGLVSNGTTINLYTKIKLDRLTTTKESTIEFKYSNEFENVRIDYKEENKESKEYKLSFISKNTLLRSLFLEDSSRNLISKSYDNEVGELKLVEKVSNQVIGFRGKIVNNFDTKISNVEIIIKLPNIGIRDNYDTDLETTFDSVLKSKVITSALVSRILYSEKINASKDDNSWNEYVSDLSKIKSVKIVLENVDMNRGENLEFSGEIEVQDYLDYNQKNYFIYDVYYDFEGSSLSGNCTTKMVTEEKEITIEDVPKENVDESTNLSVGTVARSCLKELSAGEVVFERQTIEYTIIVTNSSLVTVNNIRVQAGAENANLYYLKSWMEPNYEGEEFYELSKYTEDDGSKGYEEFEIESLNPGETKIFKYQVIVKDLKDTLSNEVFGKIKVFGDNINEVNIETIRNTIIDGEFSILTEYGTTENKKDTIIYSLAPLRFEVRFKNISEKRIENATLKIVMSKELRLNEYSLIEGAENYQKEIRSNFDGTIIEILIPEMEPGEEKRIFLYAIAQEFDSNLESTSAYMYAVLLYNDNSYYSNYYTRDVYQYRSKLDYTWRADKGENTTLNDGDRVTFTLSLKNVGKVDIKSLTTNLGIDSGFVLKSMKIKDNLGQRDLDISGFRKTVIYDVPMSVEEEVILEYTFEVDETKFEVNQSTIETKVNCTSTQVEEVNTDVIVFNINNKYVENNVTKKEIPDSGNNVNTSDDLYDSDSEGKGDTAEKIDVSNEDYSYVVQGKYSISGKVWLDRNKDGIYDIGEDLMKGIGVNIYKVQDRNFDAGKSFAFMVTDEKGEYTFGDLPRGEYVIAYGYNFNLYNVTKYKDPKAKTNENSDVISKIYKDGNVAIGMTDVLEIVDRSLDNIDMGLIQINEFDMALEKYVSKTIVKNSKGTIVKQYNDEPLVKLEISSKVFEKSNVSIEYKIRVINEGEIDGYVNRIVDYIPEGLIFNKDLNSDWNMLEDGTLVYTGLVDKTINAGEIKEIPLILTMDMETKRSIEFVNDAELLEETNDRGFQDIDSITGNRQEFEDDFGRSSIIITVSTGRIINYTLIMISTISIIGVLILGRLIFKKKIYK